MWGTFSELATKETFDLSPIINNIRIEANKKNSEGKRKKYSQYFTEINLAQFMAQMFDQHYDHLRILDPGAGVGSLTAAIIDKVCAQKVKPRMITATFYEIDSSMIPYLKRSIEFFQKKCSSEEILFNYNIYNQDFLESCVGEQQIDRFNCIIMNPPYKKLSGSSKIKKVLSNSGIEVANLYTAFLAVSARLLDESGTLIAITPRSFCNGTYFRSFRKDFLSKISFDRIHIFNSRSTLFREDDVLQENIILYGGKGKEKNIVNITSSDGLGNDVKTNLVSHDFIIHPDDPELYVRLPHDQQDIENVNKMMTLSRKLPDIGLMVSTGKIVDFRTTDHLREQLNENNVPLVYPEDLNNGVVLWNYSKDKKKLVEINEFTKKTLIKSNFYIVVRRFTSKEEKKRVVAAFYDPRVMPYELIGFENHLNYFHDNGKGLSINLAKGLLIYLSSSHVDIYFRQFSGLTQVNANDLRNLYYPSKEQLIKLGNYMKQNLPEQRFIDKYVDDVCFNND